MANKTAYRRSAHTRASAVNTCDLCLLWQLTARAEREVEKHSPGGLLQNVDVSQDRKMFGTLRLTRRSEVILKEIARSFTALEIFSKLQRRIRYNKQCIFISLVQEGWHHADALTSHKRQMEHNSNTAINTAGLLKLR